ncbi:hypothetical protein U1Q18_035988 [Sarracenia purpurea var. burkii]
MASYGTTTIHRPSAAPPPTSAADSDESKGSPRNRHGYTLTFSFNIPSTPESAAVRIIRNFAFFGLYYVVFEWAILFAALVPKRKVSLILLLATTAVTCLYLQLLRKLPADSVVHKIVDKRLALALVAAVTVVEMVLTRAAVHLFVTLAAATPVVLAHAVLTVRDNLFVNEEACVAGELVPMVYQKTGGAEPPAPV